MRVPPKIYWPDLETQIESNESLRENLQGFSWLDDARESKVNDLHHLVIVTDKDVLWLQITVNNLRNKEEIRFKAAHNTHTHRHTQREREAPYVLGMAVGNGAANLKKDSLRSLHVHPTRRD